MRMMRIHHKYYSEIFISYRKVFRLNSSQNAGIKRYKLAPFIFGYIFRFVLVNALIETLGIPNV